MTANNRTPHSNRQQKLSDTILVLYASRSGSTAGVAETIGATLSAQGLTVDVQPVQAVKDPAPYRAVVMGSAIRMDRWLPEAMQFLQQHQVTLSEKPFAAYLVCLAMAAQDEQRREKAKHTVHGYLQPVRDIITPVSEGFFAGALNLSKIPELRYRLLFRPAVLLRLFAEGDYRNWDHIRNWANTLPQMLQPDYAGDEALMQEAV